MIYECWTNVDARFSRTYEPGDRLVRGWCDVVASTDPVPRFEVLAEDVFARHNRDDRPDGQLCPSMSIGDVVMFGEVAMSVDGIGFARVDVDRADLVVDRTWRQVIDQDRARRRRRRCHARSCPAGPSSRRRVRGRHGRRSAWSGDRAGPVALEVAEGEGSTAARSPASKRRGCGPTSRSRSGAPPVMR